MSEFSEYHIKKYKELIQQGLTFDKVYVKDAGKNKNNKYKGLGVFSKNFINQNEIVEYCHTIVLDSRGKDIQDYSLIEYSYFHECECDKCKIHGKRGLIALGNGSIINTSDSPEEANCCYITWPEEKLIIFFATKDIAKDQEILCWHGEDFYDYWCKA